MADDRPQVVGLVCGARLGRRDREIVREGGDLFGPDRTDGEDPGGPAVEALFDRPHLSRPHDLEQPGVDQHPDVMGDRALRTIDGRRELANRRRPLQDQLEEGRPQRVEHRPQLTRRGHDPQVFEVVVGDPRFTRHK